MAVTNFNIETPRTVTFEVVTDLRYIKGDPGADGITPTIGANGNWYIGDTDTGVSAEGRGLPAVTAADAGKFLRVSSSGSWVAETVANASGGEF